MCRGFRGAASVHREIKKNPVTANLSKTSDWTDRHCRPSDPSLGGGVLQDLKSARAADVADADEER